MRRYGGDQWSVSGTNRSNEVGRVRSAPPSYPQPVRPPRRRREFRLSVPAAGDFAAVEQVAQEPRLLKPWRDRQQHSGVPSIKNDLCFQKIDAQVAAIQRCGLPKHRLSNVVN